MQYHNQTGSDFNELHSGITYDVKEKRLNISSSGYFDKEHTFYSSKEYLSITRNNKSFINEIVRLHGILKKFILDRILLFMGRFWTSFQEASETQLNFSMEYYLEIDG
jgi:hypothetical protein